ncbi:N-methyl-L-tryptophan oxidase [Algoriphagus sp. oki45]|uniref:N-methyl-L-tryptophan oxidase n=1 Tax=Algoriphagus sp. oki45 TaxID=3067294 RepID=UPI0027F2ADBA|nr:N-methyl-L-tryptophan oxidase [Algoriphagus sp. oki45]
MEKQEIYDVAVIGLGAVGSSAIYHLSLSNKRVLGLDRFTPPHTLGSSHGETRITRLAVGEGEDYVALAKRSHELWRELEAKSGVRIFSQTGGILIDSGEKPWAKHGSEGFWDRTVRFARNNQISHSIPDLGEVRDRFPAFQIPDSGRVYWEKEAGYLRPELAIETQLRLAKGQGAHLAFNSPVLAIEKEGNHFSLRTPDRIFFAEKLLISSGGWIKDLLPEKSKIRFKICRQVLHWIEIDPSFSWKDSPVWMWGFGPDSEDFIYGFPSLDGHSVKMATESFLEVDHPDLIQRSASPEEQKEFWEQKVEGRISGLRPNFIQSEVCFYTVTEDARFVIEPWKGDLSALLVSACSGHGFKHSAAMGESLAHRLLKDLSKRNELDQ